MTNLLPTLFNTFESRLLSELTSQTNKLNKLPKIGLRYYSDLSGFSTGTNLKTNYFGVG